MSAPNEQLAAPPMHLRALLEGLLQRWKLIVSAPIILVLLTGAVLKIFPAKYQSGVQLLMFDPQQAGFSTPGQQPTSERVFDTQALTTEIAIIQSASLTLRVAKDLDLAKDPEFQWHGRLAALRGALGLGNNGRLATRFPGLFAKLGLGGKDSSPVDAKLAVIPGESPAVATAAALLRDHIRVSQLPLSYVLTVSATSRSPETAQRIAAKVVDDYLAGQREQRERALQQVTVWLKAQLADLKSRVEHAEDAIAKLKAESGFSDTGRGNVLEQQIADLNAQLTVARGDVEEKRAQLEQARRLAGTPTGLQAIAGGLASSMIGQLRQQQSQLRATEARLRSDLGERNPEVLAVAAELAGVNRAINEESAHAFDELQNGYDIALRRQKSLETSLQRLTAAQNDSGNYVKLQQLQRIADADSKLYESYLSQYNEVDTRESLQAFGPRIISPASVPREPILPVKMLYLAAGVMGLGIGLVLAFVLEYFQAGVKTSAQAQAMFGRPVLGALPLMKRQQSRRSGRIGDLVRVVVDAPLCPLSEAVRALRVSLHLANPDQTPMVVLVTSSLPGEGKSSIAMLLAASSGGAGERTVVVDCDLRRRTISQQFDPLKPGLTDVMTGNAKLDEIALRHPVARCDVITAGSGNGAPGDLVVSRRLPEIIARLRERYTYVIVDAPPLLAAIDTIALATVADKILIAIDGARTRSQSVAESFRLLAAETDRVAGMVFNKVAPARLGRYGSGLYY